MAAALFFAAFFLVLWGAAYALFPALERAARSVARRAAAWLRARAPLAPWSAEAGRFWLPLAAALAAGAIAIFGTAHAFTEIAKALKEESPAVRRIDEGVHDWFRSHRTPAASAVFTAITEAGGVVGMSLLVAAAVAALVRAGRLRWAAYLAITALGGALFNQLLKFHYVRARPDPGDAVLGAAGYSFPSGHSMSAAVILGALAYLAARSGRTWATKSAAFAALATLALAIGVSRLYLGVHWASDVAAGFAAGAFWVAAATTGYEVFRQYRLGRAGARGAGAAQ